MNSLILKKVDYSNEDNMNDLINLLQMYAKDPMGGNEEIATDVITALPDALKKRAYMHSFLVYSAGCDDTAKPLAFANCIESFSTFAAKGVMNIHDFAVVPAARGQNVSQFLLDGIKQHAIALGCTKITLEVLEGNKSAMRAYEKAGFSAYQLSPEMGNALFWQKYI